MYGRSHASLFDGVKAFTELFAKLKFDHVPEVSMSTTPVRKRRRPRRKKQNRAIPLLAGLAVVCVLVAAVVLLESAMSGQEPEPAVTTAPTEETLPPNPYSAEDFVYVNGYLSCTAGDYSLGIDVSEHQQRIDWPQVAQAGMEFAVVRIGYRGYTRGDIHADDYAEYNLKEAKAAGLQVGAYFYSQALNAQEAAEEAAFCVDFLKEHDLDLPLVFDWEYVSETARTGAMDTQTLTQCAKVFCQIVEEEGYEAVIYANPSLAGSLLRMNELQDYRFWLAMYTDAMDYPYKADIWQYTDEGSVPGIEGNVDINLMFHY